MEYTVIRSKRKTVGIQVKHNGEVVVRVPFFISQSQIKLIVKEKQAWIEKQLKKIAAAERDGSLTGELTGNGGVMIGEVTGNGGVMIGEAADSLPRESAGNRNTLTHDELNELIKKGQVVFAERVAYYAAIIGVDYGKITVKSYRSKWGSCKRNGDLTFNCLLLLTTSEVLDGVVVHELCHRKFMNHQKDFYAEVSKHYPDYKKWDKWLNENAARLMNCLPGKFGRG